MNINNINKKLEVQRKTSIRDSYGSVKDVYNTYLILRCDCKLLNMNRGENLNEIFYETVYEFITYFRDIQQDDILIFKNSKYNILSIEEIGIKEGLRIKAKLINN